MPPIATSGFATNFDDDLPPIEESDDELESLVANDNVDELSGWRLEWRTDGYTRFRWQVKDAMGKPITYQTEGGKVGYKRGSKYVGKKQR